MILVSRNFQHLLWPLACSKVHGWPPPCRGAGSVSAVRMQLHTILARTRRDTVLRKAKLTSRAAAAGSTTLLDAFWEVIWLASTAAALQTIFMFPVLTLLLSSQTVLCHLPSFQLVFLFSVAISQPGRSRQLRWT